MSRRTDQQWMRLWMDSAVLMADAAAVIGLRTAAMMQGGAAASREQSRMVSEKIAAGFELAGAIAGGRISTPQGAARAAVSVAGKRVRANRKRLGKSPRS